MVLTVTCNPSLDYHLEISALQPGMVNRAQNASYTAGGKGLNTARVLAALGMETTAAAFVGGFVGSQIEHLATGQGYPTAFIPVAHGTSRINVKLMDGQRVTEINAPGAVPSSEETEQLLHIMRQRRKGDYIVLAGSLPAGFPAETYAAWIEQTRDCGAEYIVDTQGEALRAVLPCRPFLIKPNHHELGELFGVEIDSFAQARHYAERLQEMGARNVLVSMAQMGGILLTEDGHFYSRPAYKGDMRNDVGAGDSMIAGFIAGYVQSGDYAHALRLGMAAGAATAFSQTLAQKAEIDEILKQDTPPLRLAPLFTDHMVLQRQKPVRIFGTAAPHLPVTVSIPQRQLRVEAAADENGCFCVFLPPQEAGAPCTLCVNEVELHDVVFGEVFLAGGQSNMEFELQNCTEAAEAFTDIEKSNVRYFYVPKNTFADEQYERDWAAAAWQTPAPEQARVWSAVAYFAAREIAAKLNVPVGIIGCNYGGSSVSCWLPEEDLDAYTGGRAYLRDYEEAIAGKCDAEMIQAYDDYVAYHAAWETKAAKCYTENPQMPWEEVLRRCGENQWPGPMGIKSPYRPCGMYQTMLRRLTPYTMRGVFYYQGENDDHRPESYAQLLQAMIARWRRDFADVELWFILVQLPMFAYPGDEHKTNWCLLREAQMQTARTIAYTGLAVILDCGTHGNIHPPRKAVVGHRVALQALEHIFGIPCHGDPPLYRTYSVEGGTIRIFFDHAQDGLVLHGTGGFEIAGSDGCYCPAQAEIDGSTLILSAPSVSLPRAARYAWVNYGDAVLFGTNGLAASPFRTQGG